MKQLKPQYACSLELAMDLVGGKWKLFLLWHLSCGTKRFCELKRIMGDITQKMLTHQLRELEQAGLISRTVHPVVPPHVDYAMTERGRALIPALRELRVWSQAYAEKEGIVIVKPQPPAEAEDSPEMTDCSHGA